MAKLRNKIEQVKMRNPIMKLKPTLNQRFCKFHLNLISLVNLGMGKIGKMGGVDSTCHDSEVVVLQQRNQSLDRMTQVKLTTSTF